MADDNISPLVKSIVKGAYNGEISNIETDVNTFLMGQIKKEVDLKRAEMGANISFNSKEE